MKIRAAVLRKRGLPRPYDRTHPLEVSELTLDEPRPGELLVRIVAAGLCHSDLSVINGSRPRPVPMAIGHEASGIVEQVGDSVEDTAVGDHVVLTFVPSCGICSECASGQPAMCRRGAAANTEGRLLRGGRRLHAGNQDIHHHLGVSAFAEYTVVDRRSAIVIDKRTPLETAALFGCAVLTGVGAVLNTGAVRTGESVAVVGLGGVGLAAILGAFATGAHPIIAVDPVESKRRLALDLGATAAVHPDDAEEAVRDLAEGGVNCALDAAGHPTALKAAYVLTARGGRTVAIGLPHPSVEISLSVTQIVAEGRTLVGSYMGSSAPQRDVPRYVALWQAGRLPVTKLHGPVVDTLGLERINEAMECLASGETVRQLIRP